MAQIVGGRVIIVPQAVSQIDDSALAALNSPGSGAIGALGVTDGGNPGEVVSFTSAAEARSVLRGGRLLDVIERMYSPSAQVQGAYTVRVARVAGTGVARSSRNIGAATPQMALVSRDFGAWTNQIRFKIEVGTRGYKATIANDQGTFTQDNLYRAVINLLYTGAAATCTAAVTATGITIDSATAAEDATFTFAAYPTLALMVNAINASASNVRATCVHADSLGAPSYWLDVIAPTDVRQTTAPNGLTATQNTVALLEWFNQSALGIKAIQSGVNPEAATLGATSNPGATSTWLVTAFSYLVGGSDGGVPTVSDWQTAFDLLKAADAQIIMPASEDPAIHAMADAHCQVMSDIVNKGERIAFVGGGNDTDSIAAIAAKAQALNSARTVFAYPGLRVFGADGQVVTVGPMHTAAALAGMAAGVAVGEPLTNKTVRAQSVSRPLNRADVETLLTSGVAVVELRRNRGPVVVQSVTTWQNDRKYTNREMSVRRTADFIVRTLREGVEDLIGGQNGPDLLVQVVSRANSILKDLERSRIIVGDAASPAFRGIQARAEGETVYLDITCSPVLPANYIVLTAHLAPYSGSRTAVGAN